jgi:hypothetical protein
MNMNNTKTFAKIILAAIGIYFLIQLIPQSVYPVVIMTNSFSWESFWLLLGGLFISGITILLIWYFFFYLRDWLSERIVGDSTTCNSTETFPWFPAALRLTCIFAGAYCLFKASFLLVQITQILVQYAEHGRVGYKWFVSSALFQMPVLLVAGIYLICGAPHFVRWQVKKTLEQCSKLENDKSASN